MQNGGFHSWRRNEIKASNCYYFTYAPYVAHACMSACRSTLGATRSVYKVQYSIIHACILKYIVSLLIMMLKEQHTGRPVWQSDLKRTTRRCVSSRVRTLLVHARLYFTNSSKQHLSNNCCMHAVQDADPCHLPLMVP